MRTLIQLFTMMMMIGFAGCGNAQSPGLAKEEPVAAVTDDQTNTPVPPDSSEALVKIITSYGNMTLKLYNETPLHRDNFLKLVKQGFYDSLLFHRVINTFMIQGGDPDSRNAAPGAMLGQGGPGYTIPAEIKPDFVHKKGALAAARMGDAVNPSKASSGSQFYLVQGRVYTLEELNMMEQRYGLKFSPKQKEAYSTVGGTPHLDNAYTVYGEITEGLSVIDAIAAVKTGQNDRPVKDVVMSMELIRDYKPTK